MTVEVVTHRVGCPRLVDPSIDCTCPKISVPDEAIAELPPPPAPTDTRIVSRQRLASERRSLTRTFRLAYQHSDGRPDVMHIYFTAGTYEDGRLGEVFIRADKTGSLAAGALDSLATMVSIMLQYGLPLEAITSKLRHTRYTPNGFTKDPEFPSCSSVGDLLAQWLEAKFAGRPT